MHLHLHVQRDVRDVVDYRFRSLTLPVDRFVASRPFFVSVRKKETEYLRNLTRTTFFARNPNTRRVVSRHPSREKAHSSQWAASPYLQSFVDTKYRAYWAAWGSIHRYVIAANGFAARLTGDLS